MAHVCPMKGCKESEGMCIHEKIMVGVVVLLVVIYIISKLI